MKNIDKDRLKTMIGGFCYAQDGGNGGYDFEEIVSFIDGLVASGQKTEQCFCKSFYDDDGILQDCTCGKCT